MSRTLDSGFENLLDDAFLRPVWFVYLGFDSDPLYVHNDLGDITTTTPSATWTGVGDLGSIGRIEESDKLTPIKLECSLSIVDESADAILSEALTQNPYQRPATVYVSARNTVTGALVAQPVEVFAGKIDDMQLAHGFGQSAVTVRIESEAIIFEQSAGLVYSDSQLQSEYSGDLGLQYLERLKNWSVSWGSSKLVNFSAGAAAPGAGLTPNQILGRLF